MIIEDIFDIDDTLSPGERYVRLQGKYGALINQKRDILGDLHDLYLKVRYQGDFSKFAPEDIAIGQYTEVGITSNKVWIRKTSPHLNTIQAITKKVKKLQTRIDRIDAAMHIAMQDRVDAN